MNTLRHDNMPFPLPLEPHHFFATRLEVLMARSGFRAGHLASLGVVWGIWKRLHPVIGLAGYAWLATMAVVHGAAIACRWFSPHAYARWCQLAAVVYRLYGGGFGAGFLLLKLFFDDVPGSVSSTHWLARHWLVEGLRHAAMLLMASAVVPLLLWANSYLRLSWAIPLQLAGAAQAVAFNAHVCSARSLASKQAQVLTHRLFTFLDAAHFDLLPGPVEPSPTPDEECAALLAFQQLALGLAAPLLVQSVLEARLFEQHQVERAAAGLPPERGRLASVYTNIAGMCEACSPLTAIAAGWVFLGILWNLALLVSRTVAETEGDAPPMHTL